MDDLREAELAEIDATLNEQAWTAFSSGIDIVIRSHRAPKSKTSPIALAVVLVGSLMSTAGVAVQALMPEVPASATVNAAAARMTVVAGPPTPDVVVVPHEPPTDERISREQGRKPTTRIEIVIEYAMAQIGDPYRWATAGPNSFDCSGLLKAAFSRVGVRLPHYTGDIIQLGTRVPRGELVRGDVVFPAQHHVGIYLGNNQFIHASSSKGGVVIGKLYAFYAARRINT